MTVEVITITNREPTEPHYHFKAFLESLKRFGVFPTILGMNEPWCGLMQKPKTLHWFLRRGITKADCIIVCDSWDLVFAKDPQEIANQWADLGKPWLCGSERNCFPDQKLENKHPKCRSSYRFLNSGFIISTSDDMLKVLDSMNPDAIPGDGEDESNPHPNDQDFYMREFLKQPIPMRLDTETQFVWNLCGVDGSNFDFQHSIPVNRETGFAPGAFHANGGAKSEPEFAKVLQHLGL